MPDSGPVPFRPAVEPGFVRLMRSDKPAWMHRCGRVETIDLLDLAALQWSCASCLSAAEERFWSPVFVYNGERCDQCKGNGLVRIAGKVDGALAGYETSTDCTACGGSGIPYAIGPADYADQLRDAVLEVEAFAKSKESPEPRLTDGFAMGLRLAAGLFGLIEGVDPANRARLMSANQKHDQDCPSFADIPCDCGPTEGQVENTLNGQCGNQKPHGPHEWYGRPAIFRKECPGVVKDA